MNIAIQEHSQPLIIDGKATAQTVLDEIKSEVQQMKAQGIEPVSYTHLTLPTTPYV